MTDLDLDATREALHELNRPVSQGSGAAWELRAKLDAALGIAGQLLARIAELEATAERGYERYAELRTLYLDVLGRGAPEAEIAAAAERRGYERAVARLRDDARYTDWWSALPPTDPEHRYWQRGRVQLADYLDAVKESNDG